MGARVATTQWSQVLAARDGSDSEARAALEMLCQTYWQPLYAYIRHQGSDPEEARDLTQAYFTELLQKNFLADVDPSKGSFRSFLLASLRNFLSHERDRDRALKRGGGTTTVSLDVGRGEESYTLQASAEMSPEEVYEHRWAITVLDRAMSRLEQESAETGDLTQFDRLKSYLTGAESQAAYGEVASDLGLSVGAIKTAVHRLRKRYGQCLRAEIAQTVSDPTEIDEEVRHLLAVVRP